MSAADSEFTIRVTGAAPPPLPSAAKKGGRKGGGGRGKGTKSNAASSGQQRRYNLRLRPSSSLDQLRRDVFALFDVPSGSTNSYQMAFLGGFPPKELDQEGKGTVHELGIRPNESLIVKFSLSNGDAKQPPAAAAAASAKGNLKDPPEAAAASSSGRQKRASAMAATANFAEIIAAQDAMMKKDKKSSKRKGTAASSASGVAGLMGSSSRRVATIGGGGGKKPKKVAMEGAGYRLSDGKSFAGSPSKRGRQQRKEEDAMFKDKDDVATKLLSSLNGGGGGNTGRFLRSAMRNMVAKSYEASRAAVRVAAVNAGEYSFEKVKGGSVVDGGGVVLGTARDHDESGDGDGDGSAPNDELGRTLYAVSYSKGIEGRGRYEEQAEIIGLALLKGVLESVYKSSDGDDDGAEGGESKDGRLRPVMIAQLSPRIFWSLVYHCSDGGTSGRNSTLTVEDMLRSTMPQLEWSHLARGGRKRGLSEKARENLRQERAEMEPSTGESSQGNEEEEAQAIEDLAESALDSATANGGDDGGSGLNERERRARAAMARFGNTGDAKPPAAASPDSQDDMDVDDWTLVTPMDDDVDELIECIMAGASSEDGAVSHDEDTAKTWASILLDGLRNWRVLANSDVDHVISNLTGRDCPLPSHDVIEAWIDAAQSRSLEEIMLEIVDGDQDALDALQDKARSSSPRDLVFWKSAPGMLLDTISPGGDEATKGWAQSDVVQWISRAETALETCTWLELYTTQTS